ncbi:MAG: hypothetical protein GX997_03675 [Bacteroidales bacterium]|nr:hypothetical protein [Bacteroidales bacterium]
MMDRKLLTMLCYLLVMVYPFIGCSTGDTNGEESDQQEVPEEISVTIDRSVKYQEIEGFGFFGAKDVWWNSSDPNYFFDDKWLTQIIDDLGITVWRNELYPNNPVESDISTDPQDGYWGKQEAMVKALKAKADEYKVPLKYLLSIWSPPGEFKIACSMTWAGDENAQRGGEHGSTKNGGTLDPEKYDEFADWLKAGLDMYRTAGINVYGLSLQNEPLFVEPYNSCVYTTYWYCDLLKNVVPQVKEAFPDVKIYGSENMLDMEGAEENYQWFYHMAIKNDPQALNCLDAFAVHGYTDGVQATAIAKHRDYWTRTREQFSAPTGKPYWMTETSGYIDSWNGDGNKPGAIDLAIAIHAALYYGRASTWVWWQGSELSGIGEFCLMSGYQKGKKYYASKHFYRFVRPGSRMVELNSSDEEILGVAFENTDLNNFVVILINPSQILKTVNFEGTDIPATFEYYITSNKSDENCSLQGNVGKESILLPANSVVTLVNGRYKEE